MRYLPTVPFVLLLFAPAAIFACSDPGSAYVGETEKYQPPDDRTIAPLNCDDSERSAFNNSMSPFRWGDVRVDIDVDIVVDFRCPHCTNYARYMDDIWRRRSDFRDRVRVTFHHFPNEGIHPGATEIHVASAAVAKQGFDYFWRLHDAIFARAARREEMDRAALEQFVEQELELDFDRFLSDVETNEIKDFVQWDREQCRAAGVSGTPSVFICGEFLYRRDRLEETIDTTLEETRGDD